jgi:penicillin-binding protein 1C
VVRAVLATALLAPLVALAVPKFDEVRKAWVSTEGVLLDRHGEVIHELRLDSRGRRLDWIALAEISPALTRTVVRAEDKRFWQHAGVDWWAMGGAAVDSLLSPKARGASTVSMQVAAMLQPRLKAQGAHRTVGQKWDQIRAARELEKAWSKAQILEAYLNLSTFRGEVQGVSAASRALFGKQASGLDENESLLLAVLLRGPNAQPAKIAERACALAKILDPPRTCEGLATLADARLSAPPDLPPAAALAPHLARALLSPEQRRVASTLDARLQAFVLQAAQRQLAALERQNVADAAVVVLDNVSGEVLAYLGNAGLQSSARFVDGARAARQAGSTLKPFLYGLAIERQLLTAASLLDDSPVNLLTPSGLYVPQNYDRDFKGLVSVRTALSGSLNVPAVRTLMLLPTDDFVDRLRAFGFDFIVEDGDFYGYSLALGSAEVSLLQLTNAYRALAMGGVLFPVTFTPGPYGGGKRAMDAATAYIVADILADRSARSVTFGLSNPLATRFWAAAKTGTSKDMRDNWCVGFSSRYTVGVWIGNFDGSAMWDVSGVTGAAPLWLDVMNTLHQNVPSHAPAMPAGVERAPVSFGGDLEAAREEVFLAGTALARVEAKEEGPLRTSIAYPAQGQIIALDPDIPGDAQRVRFAAAGAQAGGATWRLDGVVAREGFWVPAPGRHVLTLHDAQGRELDRVEFEVRGGQMPPRP